MESVETYKIDTSRTLLSVSDLTNNKTEIQMGTIQIVNKTFDLYVLYKYISAVYGPNVIKYIVVADSQKNKQYIYCLIFLLLKSFTSIKSPRIQYTHPAIFRKRVEIIF